MNSVKVIHCADLHLGAAFSAVPEKACERQDEQLQTFNRIIDLCNAIEADILLIAGDLFDSSFVPDELFATVAGGFRRLKSTLVFIATGNHDPASIDSVYVTKEWPENVGLFTGDMLCYELENINVRVWGCGFTKHYQTEPVVVQDVPEDGYINLMVLHGEIVSQGKGSQYRPITKGFIGNSRMDYIALGHIHAASDLQYAGKTAYAYSGNPEPLGFDETGSHGVNVLRISKERCEMDFAEAARRMYAVEKIDISETSTQDEIAAKIETVLRKKYGEYWYENLYRIKLTGLLPADFIPSPAAVSARLNQQIYYAGVEDQTKVKANIELLSKENSLRGAFVRGILAQKEAFIKSGDDAGLSRCEDALNIGLRAFEGEVALNDYC